MTDAVRKIELLTTARDDLVDVCKVLAQGFDHEIMREPENPVTVYVTGSYISGKKIIPDIVREDLMGPEKDCFFRGKKDFDEFWIDPSRELEVDFINTAWGVSQLSSEIFKGVQKGQLLEAFCKARKVGGISFVHNEVFSGQGSMHIYIQKMGGYGIEGYGCKAESSRLSDVFNRAWRTEIILGSDYSDMWTRYLEITIVDPRLLRSERFAEAVDMLTQGVKKVVKAIEGKELYNIMLPVRPYFSGAKL